MNPCVKCGQLVRLGGTKIRVERKNGIHHYITHLRVSDCDATKGLETVMFKPYPKIEAEKPWFQMVSRWNAANPTER